MPNGGLQRLYGTFAQLWTSDAGRRAGAGFPGAHLGPWAPDGDGEWAEPLYYKLPPVRRFRAHNDVTRNAVVVARVIAARRRIGAGSRRPAERFQRGASLAGRRSRGCARSTSCASVGLEAARRPTAVFGSRAVSKWLVCGRSGARTGRPRLERLCEKTEGRQRAGGTSALPKPSSSASCLGRPARAAALSFVGVPEITRFRRRRAPLVTRLGAALVWGSPRVGNALRRRRVL